MIGAAFAGRPSVRIAVGVRLGPKQCGAHDLIQVGETRPPAKLAALRKWTGWDRQDHADRPGQVCQPWTRLRSSPPITRSLRSRKLCLDAADIIESLDRELQMQ